MANALPAGVSFLPLQSTEREENEVFLHKKDDFPVHKVNESSYLFQDS
ncbi:hypothetical protein [Bacillus sp. LL01]|nr:hypothetical protein [Bacillus sp. LL01]